MDGEAEVENRADSTLCTAHDDGGVITEFGYGFYATEAEAARLTVTTDGLLCSSRERTNTAAAADLKQQLQTHDMHGGGEDAFTFTPIAGMATSTPYAKYDINLYTWFGGSYDGQSYKIQDMDIVSPSFSVGLFGVTAGADVRNVILFGSADAASKPRVERATDGTEFENRTGAYNIGGLVGVAYDYCEKNGSANGLNKIVNCSIAGYDVVDSSTNIQGAGTANMGGLIGMANVSLERCSSVADLRVACVHSNGHANYGSFIRAGGLAGVALHEITDCYTGGGITVAEQSLNELPDWFVKNNRTPDVNNPVPVTRDKQSFSIYYAGIVCGTYGTNFQNFRNTDGGQPSGKATISNCYTYLQLPDIKGNVRAVSLIASQADRYNRKSEIVIRNCWYYDQVAQRVSYDASPGYYFREARRDDRHYRFTAEDIEKILKGDLEALLYTNYYQNETNTTGPDGEPQPVTFADLSRMTAEGELPSMTERLLGTVGGDTPRSAADSPWGWVTVEEGYEDIRGDRAKIPGKYSFSNDAYAELLGEMTYDVDHYDVTLRAKNTGTVSVTEEKSGATFVLTVTAGITLASDPEADADHPLILFPNENAPLRLSAMAAGGNDLSGKGEWTREVSADADQGKILFPEEPDTVRGGALSDAAEVPAELLAEPAPGVPLTLYAQWEDAKVRVVYDANNKTGQTLTEYWDAGETLPLPSGDLFRYENYAFFYWRVLPQGLKLDPGERVPLVLDPEAEEPDLVPGASVDDLSSVANSTVTLYAIWKNGFNLTLKADSVGFEQTVRVANLTRDNRCPAGRGARESRLDA